MRMMELVKLLLEIIRTAYPIYKDWIATKKKKADRRPNSDQLDSQG